MPTRTQAALAVAVLTLLASGVRAADPIDSDLDRDPELPAARLVKTFPENLAALWVQALDRPDAETKAAAAQAIALAHRTGLTGLEVAVAPLTRELDRPGQHPTVRLAVAHALATLDARQSAEGFFRQLDADDADLREVVEPALARWDFRPARAVWLGRLGEESPHRRRHLLAMRSLGEVREEEAVSGLRKLATASAVPQPVRLEAARALAAIRRAGLEADAAPLAADATPFGRLVAASLLRHHQGDAALRLLLNLARDADPTVAAVALARLTEIDTKLVVPLLATVLASPDANVRAFGVETLFRQPSDAHVKLLGDRLDDLHPDVRTRARVALRELAARPELNGPVLREGTRILAGTDWRGQEQAALLLGLLDHKPAAKRLLEVLRIERGEAKVASGWALRRLAIPETLPGVLEFVRAEHRRLLDAAKARRRLVTPAIDRQLAQLVEFMGKARYQPAEATLREMLPRLIPGIPATPPETPLQSETRAAVVWSLGLLHEGEPDAVLVKALEARLTDLPTPAGAEHDRVRRMAAVSLGRMNAAAAVPTLRRFYRGELSTDPVNNACIWALVRITGEPPPPPRTIERPERRWFLSPLD